jgi:hypothetical protein
VRIPAEIKALMQDQPAAAWGTPPSTPQTPILQTQTVPIDLAMLDSAGVPHNQDTVDKQLYCSISMVSVSDMAGHGKQFNKLMSKTKELGKLSKISMLKEMVYGLLSQGLILMLRDSLALALPILE